MRSRDKRKTLFHKYFSNMAWCWFAIIGYQPESVMIWLGLIRSGDKLKNISTSTRFTATKFDEVMAQRKGSRTTKLYESSITWSHEVIWQIKVFGEWLLSAKSHDPLIMWIHPQAQKATRPSDHKIIGGNMTKENDTIQLPQGLLPLGM